MICFCNLFPTVFLSILGSREISFITSTETDERLTGLSFHRISFLPSLKIGMVFVFLRLSGISDHHSLSVMVSSLAVTSALLAALDLSLLIPWTCLCPVGLSTP